MIFSEEPPVTNECFKKSVTQLLVLKQTDPKLIIVAVGLLGLKHAITQALGGSDR